LPAPAIHPLRISKQRADHIEAVIDMRISATSEPADADRKRRKVPPTKATLEAEYQRKIATGWLYLVDITSDDLLRASYERLARHHLQSARLEEAEDPIANSRAEPVPG
jgi:hypothetical protein